MKKIPWCLAICLALFSIELSAQEAILTSGSLGSSSSGSFSSSIGQVAYSEYSSSSGTVREGVQQTYDITTLMENQLDGLSINVFPNPTNDLLRIDIEGHDSELDIQLLDINGKSILNRSIGSGISELNMSELSPAAYFLELSSEGEKIKTIKIIKN